MKKHADSIDAAILLRIRSGAAGHVFSPMDFLDLGSRAAIDKALSRNCQAGQISRAGRGLYHVPREHPVLGRLEPKDQDFLAAITRRDHAKIFSSGAHAANALGLSDQVPARPYLFTTGRSRRIRRGKGQLVLRHVSARFVSVKNHQSAMVILALRWMGRKHVDEHTIATLRRNLSAADRAALPADAASAPAWIAAIFHRLANATSPR